MESRKKRLGPSKFGVWYENQRASWQSERTLASWFLIWVDTLDYHEIQAFSWRLLREYLFQLLTCRVSNSYDVNLAKNCLDSWMKSHPNGQTYLSSRSLLIPHWKHALRKTEMHLWWSRVISSWSWLVLRRSGRFCDTLKWQRFDIFHSYGTATFWAFES